MEVCRETVPPFFKFVKAVHLNSDSRQDAKFLGEKTINTKRTNVFIIRSLLHHAKSLISKILSSPL